MAVVELGAGLAVPTVRKTSEQAARAVDVGKGYVSAVRMRWA